MAVLCLSPVIGKIPIAALAGLMFTVAAKTFEWQETYTIVKAAVKGKSAQTAADLFGMLATMLLSLKVDMGLGVVVGVVISHSINILNFLKSKFSKSSVTIGTA